MHMDPMLPRLVAALVVIVTLALLLRRSGAPTLVVYLLAGVALGPDVLAVLDDRDMLNRIGEFGVLMLLFFVGMEMSLPRLLKGWRVAVFGTALQIGISVGATVFAGSMLGWPPGRSVLLGFVISLSSTAVGVRLLQDRSELDTPVGQDVLGVLLAQDLALVPMLMAIAALSGEEVPAARLVIQALVGIAAVVLLVRARANPAPFQTWIDRVTAEKELRPFAALLFCLGLALITAAAGLSTASGAFLAGLLLSVVDRTHWAHESLNGVYVILLAVFFAAVGSLLDLAFLREYLGSVLGLTIAAFLINSVVNTLTLRWLGRTWPHALKGGAYLSQIGEMSFVLAAVGLSAGLIGDFAHRMTISVIACTLVLSTSWIALVGSVGSRFNGPRTADTE